MTAPTISVPDFQRDQILAAAIRLTGILPYGKQPSADMIAATAMHLTLTLDELQSDNIVRRQVERTTLALTTATAGYDLGADIMDIEMGSGDVAGTIYSAANPAESIVTVISLGDYGKLTSKSTAGRPSRVLVEHLSTPRLTFWPVPDGDMTFRYAKVRWLFQSGTGATTLDLKRNWLSYITYAVAVGVCMDNSLFEKAQFIKGMADQKKALAQAGDVERGNIRFRVGQNGRNWR
jgi:hypothetical protein